MTSPYRSLPVVPPTPRAVCLWCVHCRAAEWGVLVCDARERVVPCPIVGSKVVDRGRDCAAIRFDDDGHERECPDFAPSLATRLLRAIGGRR